MAKDKRAGPKADKAKERMKPLSMDGVSLEDALRGAMTVPPPMDDSKKKRKR